LKELEHLCDVLSIAQKTEYLQTSTVIPESISAARAGMEDFAHLVARREQLQASSSTLLSAASRLETVLAAEKPYFQGLSEVAKKYVFSC
jgi:hypothetical protein